MNARSDIPNPWTVLFCTMIFAWSGCHPTTSPPADAPAAPAANTMPAAQPPSSRFEVVDVEEEADRWLFVEKTRDGAKGGWASGSFDRSRNKLEIRTEDVEQFGLYLERVPIDWDKLVVLSIDGKNSELRRRDHSRIRVQLDQHGKWAVLEP